MSHYTLIGALVVPADTEDPFTYFDEGVPRLQGSSRSGHFHSTIRSLLDLMPGHESLRFLSAEVATKKDHSSDGTTFFTLLEHAELVVADRGLSNLLDAIPRHLDSLPADLLAYWGGANRTLDAIREARLIQGGTYEVPDNEDGDSPEFFFTLLAVLRGLCRSTLDGTSNLLVYSWLPR